MENLCSFIFLTFFLSIFLGFSRYRWFYKDGKLKGMYVLIIEIISFVILELFLVYFFFL